MASARIFDGPLSDLERSLLTIDQAVILYGSAGLDGMALARLFAERHRHRFPAGVAYASCKITPSAIESHLMPKLAWYRPSLIVLDDTELLSPDIARELLVRLAVARPYSSTLTIYHEEAAVDKGSAEPWVLGGDRLAVLPVLRHLKAGVPMRRICDWIADGSICPVRRTDGHPLLPETPEYRRLTAVTAEVSEDLIQRLALDPRLLYELTPRKFEELVAELYRRRGYEAKLTPASGDGGVDVYVVSRDGVGETLWVVQAKKWHPHHQIDTGVVRELVGTINMTNASAGIILTTSFFQPGARAIERQLRYRIKLDDYLELRRMLREPPAL